MKARRYRGYSLEWASRQMAGLAQAAKRVQSEERLTRTVRLVLFVAILLILLSDSHFNSAGEVSPYLKSVPPVGREAIKQLIPNVAAQRL